VFFVNAALAANVRGIIYEVDGSNNPTDLVATSDQITSLRRGWNEVVFSSPPTLTTGQNYWIGFITDTSFVYRPGRHGATPLSNSSGSDTYADGPADPFGTARQQRSGLCDRFRGDPARTRRQRQGLDDHRDHLLMGFQGMIDCSKTGQGIATIVGASATMVAWWNPGLPRLVFSREPIHLRIV
jgi:hypothetical protein